MLAVIPAQSLESRRRQLELCSHRSRRAGNPIADASDTPLLRRMLLIWTWQPGCILFRKMLLTRGLGFGVSKCAKRVLGIGLTLYASYVGVQWIRFGRSSRRNRTEEKDDLLDRFMPDWDVAEVHKTFLECEPADGYRLACNLDPMQLPIVRFIFWTRGLIMRGSEQTPVRTGGLVS